jgi:hypothetical protein
MKEEQDDLKMTRWRIEKEGNKNNAKQRRVARVSQL